MTHKANGRKAVETRQQDAEKRKAQSAGRTPGHQIAVLDKRLGEGVGAKKERARLTAPAPDKAARKTRRSNNSKKASSK